MILQWSEPSPPTKECSYHHSTAETPFGRFLLTWKGWKDEGWQGIGFDETPWNEIEYHFWHSVEEAQAWAQEEFDRRLQECLSRASEIEEDAQ